MARRGDVHSRGEISEDVERSRNDLRETGEEVDAYATDAETFQEMLESLEFGGTLEGAESVEAALEEGNDAALDEFGERNERLDELQSDSESREGEMQEHTEASALRS